MLTAVNLDKQHFFAAGEIRNEGPDGILPDELQTFESPIAHEVPEPPLRFGHAGTQRPSSWDGFGWSGDPHPALRATLSPRGRGETEPRFTLSAHSTISAVSATAWNSTSAPAAAQSLLMSSASLWLSPSTQGHMIMTEGPTRCIQQAS